MEGGGRLKSQIENAREGDGGGEGGVMVELGIKIDIENAWEEGMGRGGWMEGGWIKIAG